MGEDTLEFEAAKKELAEEKEQLMRRGKERALFPKRENEYIQRKVKLEKFASEKVAESKSSEILAEETASDCKWLLARAIPLVYSHCGRKDGYAEKDYHFELYKQDCTAAYTAKRREYEFIEFGIVKAVEKLSRKANAIEVLKKALGDQEPEGGDAGPSHQD
ncbi:hypothetical protein Hanom_Chr13g01194761 [Helianthus anomalus]